MRKYVKCVAESMKTMMKKCKRGGLGVMVIVVAGSTIHVLASAECLGKPQSFVVIFVSSLLFNFPATGFDLPNSLAMLHCNLIPVDLILANIIL